MASSIRDNSAYMASYPCTKKRIEDRTNKRTNNHTKIALELILEHGNSTQEIAHGIEYGIIDQKT